MVKRVKVPPAVREAVAKAMYENWNAVMNSGPPWESVDDNWRQGTLCQADDAIAALFATWPLAMVEYLEPGNKPHMILPIPQEGA